MNETSDRSCQILLVEDEAAHAELIVRAFEEARGRFAVTVVPSLLEARAAIARCVPDLVVIDFNLPDGKGTEILARDREHAPFPVVVMTSHGDQELAVETMKAGAVDYVVKSVTSFSEMPRVAERAIREWRHIVERTRAEEALRASERRFRALYDGNPSMYFTVDAGGVILSVNRFGARQLGYECEELIGSSFATLFDESDRGAALQAVASVLQEPDRLHRWEARKISRDGSIIWVRDSARVVEDENGRPVILVVC
jgi:PAS domain S-box-containing protein